MSHHPLKEMEDTPGETETGCSAVGSLIKCATLNTDRSEEDSTTEPKFIFIHRPYWDAREEQQDDIEREASDEEDEEDKDDEDEDEHTNYFACTASVDDRSEWAWTITEAGLERYKQLEKQAFNRDQDSHGLYIYNDFTAYGINEVVDNWLKGYNKEISKRTVSPYAIWAELEGFAMFSQLDYIHCWFQGDDCRGFAETIALVGKALLTGLQVLSQLLRPYRPENGGLRNISMVLALFVQFVHSWTYIGGDHFGETKWVSNLVRLAKEHNIEIKGPYKFHERNQELLEPEPERDEEDSASGDEPKKKRKKIHFSEGTWGIVSLVDADSDDEGDLKDNGDYSVKGWKASFKEYTKGHARNGAKTIGGTMYDITKMSKAQKREIESGGARFWF